jgi:hypothetical protein
MCTKPFYKWRAKVLVKEMRGNYLAVMVVKILYPSGISSQAEYE